MFTTGNKFPIDCSEIDGDGSLDLQELLELIPILQKKYGKRAILSFDAGYNNVCAMIIPTKKVKNVLRNSN